MSAVLIFVSVFFFLSFFLLFRSGVGISLVTVEDLPYAIELMSFLGGRLSPLSSSSVISTSEHPRSPPSVSSSLVSVSPHSSAKLTAASCSTSLSRRQLIDPMSLSLHHAVLNSHRTPQSNQSILGDLLGNTHLS